MPVGHVSRYTIIEHEDNSFDDRTIASLVNTANGGRPVLFYDGHNDDNPYAVIPLLRPTHASLNRWDHRED